VTVSATVSLVENAPAKVNLTLRVLGRRADGYHEIESLVAFADIGDKLSFAPGEQLALTMRGPTAAQAGEAAENLVLTAAKALADRIPGIGLGIFELDKYLPVAAGLGGGSADAAAALRLLARANNLAADDSRLYEAARATGADVPVCLDPRPRLMRGIGDILSPPFDLPPLPAVLANPGVALPTRSVFAEWKSGAANVQPLDIAAGAKISGREQFLQLLMAQANDLENAAIGLAPVIGETLAALRAVPGCRLARMSGSGATCFALFSSAAEAIVAAKMLSGNYSRWWVRASALDGVSSGTVLQH
jgi:4-diphosphocytidyl-2-C-methyl-D-erythritol kinase